MMGSVSGESCSSLVLVGVGSILNLSDIDRLIGFW